MQIEFKEVSLEIDGTSILKNVSFRVRSGETRVLLGASGSGKTTLLKLLIGLLKPSGGNILIDGQDLANMSSKQLSRTRKRLSVVFQHGALFDSLNVEQNVGYRLYEEKILPDDELAAVIHQALCFVDMDGYQKKMPWELSGGQRKRISISRALASGAEAILFDEPTSGLDPINSHNVTRFIRQLKEEAAITSIVVTHDLQHAFAVASSVALLHKGEIAFDGTVDALKASEDPRVTSFIAPSGDDLIPCNIDAILGISRKRLERLK